MVIPKGVTTIGNNAFRGCTSLDYAVIPRAVENIGNNVFVTSAQNPTHLGAILIVKNNSAAHRYALTNNFDFLILGDVVYDNVIDEQDSAALLKKISGINVAESGLGYFEAIVEDANMDGNTDILDAIEIQNDIDA